MSTVKLSDDFVESAKATAIAMHRSVPKQIEYWARLGKIAEENPDLPMAFVTDVLIGLQEVEAGEVSEYAFE
jgi:ParD-like antitoxin of type II bacterial toxin-antitoxin system